MSDEKGTGSGRVSTDGPFARLGAAVDNLVRSVIPSEAAVEHFANARIEVLKGIRAVIDARIDRLSSETKKGVSVSIE